MPNIQEQPTRPKGNGNEILPHHRKNTKLQIKGCYKHPNSCDDCNLPVEQCNGNFKSGEY